MASLNTYKQTAIIPPQADLIALSKTLAIIIVFVLSTVALLFGNLTSAEQQYAVQLAIATGSALGILGITDIIANVINVRAFLGNSAAQSAGVFPQASNTTLVTAPTPTPTPSAEVKS